MSVFSVDLNTVFWNVLQFKLPSEFFFLLFVFLLTVRIFHCLKIDEPFRSLFFPPSFSSSSFASFEMADYVIINDSNFLWDGTLYPLQCYSPLKFIRRSSLGVRLTYRFDTGVCSRKAILNGHEFVHYIICPNFFLGFMSREIRRLHKISRWKSIQWSENRWSKETESKCFVVWGVMLARYDRI